MTVETTSFLSGAKITSTGSEKSAKFLKNHKNLIIFLLAVILLLFCVSASVLQIFIYNRMNGMQDEIDQLRTNIADMKRNIGFDDELFDDLDDFDKKYNQNDIKDEIDVDERDPISDSKIKFDDVGEDDEDDDDLDSEELDELNYEGPIHSGYGDTYDEDDDEYDSDSLEDAPTEGKKDDDNNIYKDMTRTRKTRSITGVTDQGVPIREEPYVLRKNRSRNPTDNYAANILLPNSQQRDEKNPKLKLTWDNNRRNGPRREFQERNRARHHHQDSRNRFAFAAAPVHHSFENYGKKFNETSTNSSPISTSQGPVHQRRSRVMHVEDKTKAFRQVVRKDQLERLQEVKKAPEQWSPQQNINNRRRVMSPIRKNLELRNGKRMRITAVHYEGDSSLPVMGHHEHQGNNRVQLESDKYIHWQPADWTSIHGMDRFFSMDNNGILTVNDQGLFLIYAQVYYSDQHNLNGYTIELNDREQFRCATTSHTTNHVLKVFTCYTSGLINLNRGDRIKIRDSGNNRSVLLAPSRSFFGLMKINMMPVTSESSEIETFGGQK